MEKGIHFTNAHYLYANTETIVGHTTLATGTFPSQHGMVGNVRFFCRPYLYLDDEKIAVAKLDPAKVEQAMADGLTDFDGIAA